MPRGTRVLEIVQALAEAVERGDEGDMDSPAWENDDRMLRLYTELKILSQGMAPELLDENGIASLMRDRPGYEALSAG